jgi:hypothetical protein
MTPQKSGVDSLFVRHVVQQLIPIQPRLERLPMPPLTDPERLRCYKSALANRRYDGFITFTKDALRWLHAELPDFSPRDIAQMLHNHVAAQGDKEIDEQRETREQWRMHDYHYDLRIGIAGRLVYFETRLSYRNPNDPDDPLIDVVNIHDA